MVGLHHATAAHLGALVVIEAEGFRDLVREGDQLGMSLRFGIRSVPVHVVPVDPHTRREMNNPVLHRHPCIYISQTNTLWHTQCIL